MSRRQAKLWGGRLEGALDPDFSAFNQSLPLDRHLFDAELRASAAWARALARAGVLSASEVRRLESSLRALGRDVARTPQRLAQADAEDVHAFVEAELTARLGPLGRRLHTGRSRNDQVATDLKLYLRERLGALDRALAATMAALAALAEREAATAMPGYTHLQRAQPITAGHHALAYVEMLARDRGRIADGLARMDTCPLGSGALAGTPFAVGRRALARDLGFAAPTQNSLDAVSDRDHAFEAAFACALVMVHLSRLAEDWIFFASQEAGFLILSEATSTGSSLMPQKKNPDALELVRGKVGRVLGALQALLVTAKGLPLAYDKDLQEDKAALFDALDTAQACLAVTRAVVTGARFDKARCAEAAARGYQNATDLADLLVAAGVPFRDAHHRVGLAVRAALHHGVELEALPPTEAERLLPELQPGWQRRLQASAVLARRREIGGTAPSRVRAQARSWRSKLRRWAT